MINDERPDTVIEVRKPIVFTNIIARKLWDETDPVHIYSLQTLLNATVFRNRKVNLNDEVDRICADAMLVDSILFN